MERGTGVEAVEICIRGDLYFFENHLTREQLENLEVFTLEYCMSRDLNSFNIDEFVDEVESGLHIILRRIRISHVIAV